MQRNMRINRISVIRLIQVGLGKLGIKDSEEEYRALYERATGRRSLREMTDRELLQVVETLKTCGFAADRTGQGAGGAPLARDPQARKIRSLWLELRDLGALRNSSEYALLAFVQKHTCMERMEWLNSAQKSCVIETLKSWVTRVEAEQAGASCRDARPGSGKSIAALSQPETDGAS